MKKILHIILTVFAILQGGCPRPSPRQPTDDTITTVNSSTQLENRIINGSIPGCVDAIELVGQVLTLPTMQMTLDAGGIPDLVSIVTSNATYTFSTRLVNVIDCNPTDLPATPPVTIEFGFNYLGEFNRINPLCINASTIEFTDFSITGTPLDALVEAAAREMIWLEVDRQVASEMHSFINGGNFPQNANPRCGNWVDLLTLQ